MQCLCEKLKSQLYEDITPNEQNLLREAYNNHPSLFKDTSSCRRGLLLSYNTDGDQLRWLDYKVSQWQSSPSTFFKIIHDEIITPLMYPKLFQLHSDVLRRTWKIALAELHYYRSSRSLEELINRFRSRSEISSERQFKNHLKQSIAEGKKWLILVDMFAKACGYSESQSLYGIIWLIDIKEIFRVRTDLRSFRDTISQLASQPDIVARSRKYSLSVSSVINFIKGELRFDTLKRKFSQDTLNGFNSHSSSINNDRNLISVQSHGSTKSEDFHNNYKSTMQSCSNIPSISLYGIHEINRVKALLYRDSNTSKATVRLPTETNIPYSPAGTYAEGVDLHKMPYFNGIPLTETRQRILSSSDQDTSEVRTSGHDFDLHEIPYYNSIPLTAVYKTHS